MRYVVAVLVVVGLVIIGYGAWFVMRMAAHEKAFPEEKWTCGQPWDEAYEVVWESKRGGGGTDVHVKSPTHLELFALSCLPVKDNHCFDNPGWSAAKIDVTGSAAPVSISFARDSTNVDDSYRHHADLYWDLARSIIAAFRAGTNADIATLGAKGEVLKVTKVNLNGFGPAMDKCSAIWPKEK